VSRYVIGYVGVQTEDGRTITEPPSCDGVIPVLRKLGGDGTYSLAAVGTAQDLQIDDAGVMTIDTDVAIDLDLEVLSLSIAGSTIDLGDPRTELLTAGDQKIAIVGGQLEGLVVIDRAQWAWRNVPRGTST
jgi:hypothetical protein